MSMSTIIVIWMWFVGIPLAFATFNHEQDKAATRWAIIATFWPITAPMLLVLLLLGFWAEKRLERKS